ncbi:MAG: Lpg1974 family pore-forming outer membrane protein [Parachlamydiales bacterium]|jgi:hypothetical protein
MMGNFVKAFSLKHFLNIFITIVYFFLSFSPFSLTANILESNNRLNNTSVNQSSIFKNFDVFANLIVWTAKEAGSDCWAEVIASDSLGISNNIQQVHFGWTPGFRVGGGYGKKHNHWDSQAYYTRFHTQGEDSISSGLGTVHSTFLGNFYVNNASGKGLSGPAYQKASIDWSIHFNMIDWELGRKFWINKLLILHPFLGIKGGRIDQIIKSKWQNPDVPDAEFFRVGTEDIKNNYWGIGPRAGINTKWNLSNVRSQFYFFGDFSGAIMWGHWSFADIFQNDRRQEVFVDLQNISGGSSMMQTFTGIGWDANFDKNRYRFSIKLGYEMQFWLDQLQFYSFTGGRLVNELTLQGGTLECYLDF